MDKKELQEAKRVAEDIMYNEHTDIEHDDGVVELAKAFLSIIEGMEAFAEYWNSGSVKTEEINMFVSTFSLALKEDK